MRSISQTHQASSWINMAYCMHLNVYIYIYLYSITMYITHIYIVPVKRIAKVPSPRVWAQPSLWGHMDLCPLDGSQGTHLSALNFRLLLLIKVPNVSRLRHFRRVWSWISMFWISIWTISKMKMHSSWATWQDLLDMFAESFHLGRFVP